MAHQAVCTFDAPDPAVADAVDLHLCEAREGMRGPRPPAKRDNGRPRMAVLYCYCVGFVHTEFSSLHLM
jgi:hypothetical protein